MTLEELKAKEAKEKEELKHARRAAERPPSTPAKGQESLKGFPRPRRRWSERCSTCEGTGLIFGISSKTEPCPRCAENE